MYGEEELQTPEGLRQSGELEKQAEGFKADNMNFSDSCDRLERIIDRLSYPEPKEGSGEIIEKPGGILGQLEGAGKNYRDNLNRLNYLVERLDSLI